MTLANLVKPVLVAGLLSTLITLTTTPVLAAPSAEQVLEASPVDDIVARYPAMMSQGIREGLKRSGQVPPMVADTIGYVVSNSFRAEDIERKIVAELGNKLTEQQLSAVHEWYATPVAGKIAAAEIAASDPEAWAQIRAQAPALNEKYQGKARAKLFDRYDRAARATESAVDSSIAVQLGLATAMAALSRDSVHYDQLEQRIESQRSMIRGVVEQQVYDAYLYTYEGIGLQELDLYLDFLESKPGSAFTDVVTQSLQQAITGPIESVGEQMARFLAPSSSSQVSP